ncbi:MazG-like family protein [Roseibium aggregatum]|uniref:MazG-like family protein n=1 Tax=Roseibium aggregatum TaxID=187304 RepID=A0A939EGU3_9HYPH|nr:MazG-like family protein [Roseibium aggregatum]MBN9672486.1 MazG-like family protein [Roseibium aggregatum]
MFNIYELTQQDPKTLQERALKLTEEAGELAQAILTVTRAPGSTYKPHTIEDVREEAVDAAICALSVLAQACASREEFEAELDRLMTVKCAKWREKLESGPAPE